MSVQQNIVIIVPCYNEEAVLAQFHRALQSVLDQCPDFQFRILFIDDGSQDATLDVIRQLKQEDPRVGFLALSRNFGHQVALSAGLDHCQDADAAVMMDCDLQHPPELIPRFIEAWKQGAEIVSGRRTQTNVSLAKGVFSGLFYKLFNLLSDTRIEPNVADFGLFSRGVIEAFQQMPERHRFLRGLTSWVGFRRELVDFEAPPRAAGETKYSWTKMFSLGLTAVYSFSPQPLRIAIRLGLLLTFLGMLYLAFVIWSVFYTPEKIQAGWASVIAVILIMSGVNLLFTGLVGEYVARIYEEAKQRPLYLVRQSEIPEWSSAAHSEQQAHD